MPFRIVGLRARVIWGLAALSLGLVAQFAASGQTGSIPVVVRDKEAGRHSIDKIPSNIQRYAVTYSWPRSPDPLPTGRPEIPPIPTAFR